MADDKNNFRLFFEENLKKDGFQTSTDTLCYDDLADFSHEREKISRELEKRLKIEPKVDYGNFSNHVFFHSALDKFNKIKSKILDEYPYNGTIIDKENFELSGTDYQKYILKKWPRNVSYVEFDGSTNFITASDYDNILRPGSSSLYVSVWAHAEMPSDEAKKNQFFRKSN